MTSPSAPTHLSDADLVAAVQAGSEIHFNELYARFFPRVYRFAAARVANRADAEEIAQEVFAAIFRSLHSYRGESSLVTWIFGVARNTVNNHLRRQRQDGERFARITPEALQPSPSLGDCTPEEHLALRRYVGAIRDQLADISEWQLDVFRLRHEENLPIREIARLTSRSSDAIRSSLYRVKRALVAAVETQRENAPRSRSAWGAV